MGGYIGSSLDYRQERDAAYHIGFWRIAVLETVLHAIWDMPFGSMLFMVALVVAVWIVIMILVNMGLKELSGRVSQYNNDSQL